MSAFYVFGLTLSWRKRVRGISWVRCEVRKPQNDGANDPGVPTRCMHFDHVKALSATQLPNDPLQCRQFLGATEMIN